ncbi:MAG: nucleotide exchange factor GrpE [Candidatus Shikimatogenerans bostrichidophilus]|nr:MAG: nucleotide exchange factor GrpE [Candidatus Shikimatogenerans bostrichidophilus]
MNKIKNIKFKKIIDKYKNNNLILKKKNNLLKDKFIRTLAEFENYKKRNEKEKKDLFKINTGNLIKTILPVLDDFNRFIIEEKVTKNKGIYLIYLKFKKILKDFGLNKIKVNIGDIFNPDYHYAISQVEKNNMKNKIIDILEDGYYVYDNIIRCTKVIVGK